MALGATQKQVLSLVLKEGLALAVVGLALGLVGSYFVGHIMQKMLFGVGAVDFAVFFVVSIVLFASASVACYLPARRASTIEPMDALRTE